MEELNRVEIISSSADHSDMSTGTGSFSTALESH